MSFLDYVLSFEIFYHPGESNMYGRLVSVLLVLIAIFFLQLGLVACNTMQGVGQDLEAAGDKIESTAKKKKSY